MRRTRNHRAQTELREMTVRIASIKWADWRLACSVSMGAGSHKNSRTTNGAGCKQPPTSPRAFCAGRPSDCNPGRRSRCHRRDGGNVICHLAHRPGCAPPVLGSMGRSGVRRIDGSAFLCTLPSRTVVPRERDGLRPPLGRRGNLGRRHARRVGGLRGSAPARPPLGAPRARGAPLAGARSLVGAPGMAHAAGRPPDPGDRLQSRQLCRWPNNGVLVDLHLGHGGRHPADDRADGGDGRPHARLERLGMDDGRCCRAAAGSRCMVAAPN